MPEINVKKAFRLNLGTETKHIGAGRQNVSEEVASHWYTLQHLVPEDAEASATAPVVDDEASQKGEGGEPAAENTQDGNGSGENGADENGGDDGAGADHQAAEAEQGDTAADAAGETDNADDEASQKAALKAEAEALGIDVDGRWGITKLQSAIDAKKAKG